MMNDAPQFQIVFAQLGESMESESESFAEDLADIEELRRLVELIRDVTAPDLIFSTGS